MISLLSMVESSGRIDTGTGLQWQQQRIFSSCTRNGERRTVKHFSVRPVISHNIGGTWFVVYNKPVIIVNLSLPLDTSYFFLVIL